LPESHLLPPCTDAVSILFHHLYLSWPAMPTFAAVDQQPLPPDVKQEHQRNSGVGPWKFHGRREKKCYLITAPPQDYTATRTASHTTPLPPHPSPTDSSPPSLAQEIEGTKHKPKESVFNLERVCLCCCLSPWTRLIEIRTHTRTQVALPTCLLSSLTPLLKIHHHEPYRCQ